MVVIDETKLFASIRSIENSGLSQSQVDSVHAILESCNKHSVTDKRQISYILATAYHESGLTPIEEHGKGAGRDYGKKLKMGAGPGKRIPYTTPDQLYYGRGFTQITWYENYEKFGRILKVDLLNYPTIALQPDYAAEIMVIGMNNGLFTGVGLSRYFNQYSDPFNARKIINGLDKAKLISGYYSIILNGLT